MARKLTELFKADIGLIAQTINNNNATGDYYDMRGWRKAVAVCVDGANAINKATQVEFMQATAKAGTDAKVVKQGNASGGTESKAVAAVAATKATLVTEATITFGTVLAGTTITINGVVFTAHANTTTASKREFKIDGNDAADCTAFCGLVNDATYGVPGVTAVDGESGACTLVSTEAGEVGITVATSAIATAVIAVTKQVLISEIDVNDLDLAGGFYWVAVKVTKAGNGIVGATLIRSSADYPRAQVAAASVVI